MSKGPITAAYERDASESRIAGSAVLLGQPRLGQSLLVAEGAVLRSDGPGVVIETGSAVLENSVVVGAAPMPTSIGRRTTFGHRCLVIGATVGDVREIGNASILMPGATLGDVFLGEDTLVPNGTILPVSARRPARG